MQQRLMLMTPVDLGVADRTIDSARALDDAAILTAARRLEDDVPAEDAAITIDRYGAYDGVAVTLRWNYDEPLTSREGT